MKKISQLKYIFLSILAVSVLTSCELETNPTDAVEESRVFETVAGNDKVINGTWGSLMETFNTYANPGFGSVLRASDAMGSDVVLNAKYGFRDHYAFNALYGRGGTNTLSWNLSYKTINNMNNVLVHIDQAQGSDIEKARVKGQAFALRGYMYLHLASTYAFAIDKDPNALAVPIYVKPTTSSSEPNALSTVAQVYAQAISDFKEALDLIPADYSRAQKFQIDRSVVLGLLSRASLYSRNWEDAKKYSDDLLASNNYLMNEVEYKSGFNDVANGEWIWGHAQTGDQQNASYQFHYLDVTTPGTYYFSFNADPYFKDLFDDSDYRKSMIYWAQDPGLDPAKADAVWMRYAKFKFKADFTGDIVLMRTSEIYLINAEAKAHLGDVGGALLSLNALKQARGAETTQGLNASDLLDEIAIERRKELFGEGFSLVDIIRTQKSVVRNQYHLNTVPFTFTNASGETQTREVLANGHHVLVFPDKTPFEPNSKYYLFRIPTVEERENPNL